MIQGLLAQIGLPLLINFLAETLGAVNSPVTKTASKVLSQVDQAIKAGQISPDQIAEANRHAEALATLKYQELRAGIEEVNKSLRAEVASEDKYVRRMRPTFGYLMALTWAAQMFGVAYVMVFETEKAAFVLNGMASLSAIWGVGLSVLGIYVYKRSEDKKLPSPINKAKEIIHWNKSSE